MIAKFYWLTAISFLLIAPSNVSSQANVHLLLPSSIQSNNSTENSHFLDFKGKATKCTVKLEWKTSSKSNLSHFELERANGSGTFKKIGTIKAIENTGSNTQYSFEDFSVRLTNHFRIKAISFNGEHEYSEIINVLSSCGKKKVLVEAYLKPITQTVTIHAINNSAPDDCFIEIYQSFGSTIFKKPISLKNGLNTIKLSTANLLPDDYYVQLTSDDWKSKPRKIKVD